MSYVGHFLLDTTDFLKSNNKPRPAIANQPSSISASGPTFGAVWGSIRSLRLRVVVLSMAGVRALNAIFIAVTWQNEISA